MLSAKTIGYLLILSASCSIAFNSADAHSKKQKINKKLQVSSEEFKKYYENLDAKPNFSESFDRKSLKRAARRNRASQRDIENVIARMGSDPCADKEIKPACDYFTREAMYKASNLAFTMRSKGKRDRQIITAIQPILEYGAKNRLERLYGKEGLKEGRNARLLERLPCLGLRIAIQERTLANTNPFYGRRYRLVTCAGGFNWQQSFIFFRVHLGFVFTHSRFARHILAWHSTGAEPHICARATVFGGSNNLCNTNSWTSPVAIRLGAAINLNSPQVTAQGHAHRLGQQFNTNISF